MYYVVLLYISYEGYHPMSAGRVFTHKSYAEKYALSLNTRDGHELDIEATSQWVVVSIATGE